MHLWLGRSMVAGLSLIAALVLMPGTAAAYPGGPALFVTDLATNCATCHAMTKAEYAPERPADYSNGELPPNKHYKALESADKGYKLVPEDKRKAVLELVKWVDDNSSVSLKAPTSAKPGQPIEVKVVGPDGKEQSWWLDKRVNEKKNLSFVLVQAQADPEKKTLPTSQVTWTVRAPIDPGTYTLTAGFLYGTEDPDELKTGKLVEPTGGRSGPSGRIKFSEQVTVQVR